MSAEAQLAALIASPIKSAIAPLKEELARLDGRVTTLQMLLFAMHQAAPARRPALDAAAASHDAEEPVA